MIYKQFKGGKKNMEVSPFYDKQQKCLNCSKPFTTQKVRSKAVKVDNTTSDFQPIYSPDSIPAFYYNVFVCEHCGFAYTEDFTDYFSPNARQEIQKFITDKWVRRSFGNERTIFQAIEAYKLALVSGSIKKEKFVTMAGIALRLAWLYRLLKNDGQEKRFLTLSRDHYIDSFSTDDYNGTQMSMVRVLYMVAELSRLIDDSETATKYFSKVIEKQSIGGDTKIIDMAKEQWNILREKREHERLENS